MRTGSGNGRSGASTRIWVVSDRVCPFWTVYPVSGYCHRAMPFRLTSSPPPTWFTAECAVCHTGNESRTLWFDGDIEVHMEGTYMICAECVREGAHQLGMFDEDQADALLTRALSAETQVESLLADLAEARGVVEVLRRYDAGVEVSAPAPVVEPEPAVSFPPAAGSDDEGPVLEFPCPASTTCTRRWPTEHGAKHHADLKHRGWRAAK